MWWIFLIFFTICSKVLYAHLSRVWRWSLSASQWQLCGTILCSWLMKCETAAVSAYVMCTSCNHAPDYSHFIWSQICSMHVWDLFHALVVTGGWNRCWNKSQHRKLALEKKILLTGIRTHDLSIMSLALCHWAIPAPCTNFVYCFGKTTQSSGDLIVFLLQRTWACNFTCQIVLCKLLIVELNNMWDKCEHFS